MDWRALALSHRFLFSMWSVRVSLPLKIEHCRRSAIVAFRISLILHTHRHNRTQSLFLSTSTDSSTQFDIDPVWLTTNLTFLIWSVKLLLSTQLSRLERFKKKNYQPKTATSSTHTFPKQWNFWPNPELLKCQFPFNLFKDNTQKMNFDFYRSMSDSVR